MSEVGCRYYRNSECKATNLLDNSGFTTEYFFMKIVSFLWKMFYLYENCFIFMKVVSFLWKLFHFYERISFLRKSFIFHFTVLLVASIRFLKIFFFDSLRSCRLSRPVGIYSSKFKIKRKKEILYNSIIYLLGITQYSITTWSRSTAYHNHCLSTTITSYQKQLLIVPPYH